MTDGEHTPSVKFIPDDAASADFFGSHEPVATAIAAVIRHEPNLKVIGLMGAWGSGKSTVLNILKSKLALADPSQRDNRFFVYDAWVHQSDPPRRSFLETLVNFLAQEGLTTKAEWQEDLDRLNRRVEEHDTQSTPTLTLSGKFIGASLLLFPIGLALLSPIWAKSTFAPFGLDTGINVVTLGCAFLLAPALVALCIYYLWRPIRKPAIAGFFNKSNWTQHRHPHERSTIFSIFVNKAIDHVTNRVIRTPDPTAIEFQETYQKLMSAVSVPQRRFVFVIDELDRIPESEAVMLWSTVRSFFLASSQTSSPSHFTPPIVILPLDPHTVRRMYGKDTSDGNELAQSFLDKTFDLVFRVAPPVVSDWQSYLASKLREALGPTLMEQDIYVINKLYATFLVNRGGAEKKTQNVTPRTIIKLVNLIVTLKLQHGTNVSLPAIAYYAIHKNRIEEDIGSIIQSDDSTILRFEPNWHTLVAATYFNVPAEKALQLLMLPQLQASIVENDTTTFNTLAKVPGFGRVLEQLSETFLTADDPVVPTNAAYLHVQASVVDSPQIVAIDNNLRTALSGNKSWISMNANTAAGVRRLLESCSPQQFEEYLTRVLSTLTRLSPEFDKSDQNIENWMRVAETMRQLSTSRGGVALKQIDVPGAPPFFLRVIHYSAHFTELLSILKPTQNKAEIIQLFAANAASTGFTLDIESQFDLLRRTGIAWPWETLIATAGSYIEKEPVDDTGTATALRILSEFRKEGNGNELNRLSDAGHFLDKLSQAHSKNFGDTEATVIALLILMNPKFDMPTAVGNSEAGRQLANNLVQTLADRPQLFNKIDAQLARFGGLQEIINAVEANPAIRELGQRIFSDRVKADRIGPLNIADVIQRLSNYLKLLDEDRRLEFIRKLPEYPSFWDKLKDTSFGENSNQIFDALIDLDDATGEQARAEVYRRAQGLTANEWETEIARGGVPLKWILKLVERADISPDFGEPLEHALRSALTLSVNGATFDRTIMVDWFKLARSLSPYTREVLFKDIRDQMISSASTKILPALTAGSDSLLVEGQYLVKADDAVRRIVNPLLDVSEGRSWLVANALRLSEWTAKADDGTRRYLAERLSDILSGGEEASVPDATQLVAAWRLESLLLQKPIDGDNEDTASKSDT